MVLVCSDLVAGQSELPPALKSYLNSFEREPDDKQEKWLSPDKGTHVMGSMISTTLIGQISLKEFDNSTQKSQIIGAGTTFALGLAKEIFDSRQPYNIFSWKDLTANGVGIIIGIILLGAD
jgi:uncharacterized protein YfiM (DUF2279 family)